MVVPSEKEHQKKYNDNKDLLENELEISNSTRYNWIATVAFYSALHLIEEKLATYGIHSKNHKARENMVNTYRDFKTVRVKYKMLYTWSIVARYAGESITEQKAREALKYLNDIEVELSNR